MPTWSNETACLPVARIQGSAGRSACRPRSTINTPSTGVMRGTAEVTNDERVVLVHENGGLPNERLDALAKPIRARSRLS